MAIYGHQDVLPMNIPLTYSTLKDVISMHLMFLLCYFVPGAGVGGQEIVQETVSDLLFQLPLIGFTDARKIRIIL